MHVDNRRHCASAAFLAGYNLRLLTVVQAMSQLDAVYGELDKFESWIVNNRTGFFVSAYTRSTCTSTLSSWKPST